MLKQQMGYWRLVMDEVANKSYRDNFRFTNLKPKVKRGNKKMCKQKHVSSFNGINFSKREEECMHLFLRGKTIKAAAEDLGLSSRTVEYYLRNMRIKTKCSSKSELIAFVIDKTSALPKQNSQ